MNSENYIQNNKDDIVEMDFGGYLFLNKKAKWVYVLGIGDYKIEKNTLRKNINGAKKVAQRLFIEIGNKNRLLFDNLFKNCRKNAKTRGIKFDLTQNDIMSLIERSQGRCELTNIEFRIIDGIKKNKRQPFAPSIDRIDSSHGYNLDNCRLICIAANYAINTWGDWVLIEMVEGINSKRDTTEKTKRQHTVSNHFLSTIN